MPSVKVKYFDYDETALQYLRAADQTLGQAIDSLGRVERVVIPDVFVALVYAIIGQLVSVR